MNLSAALLSPMFASALLLAGPTVPTPAGGGARAGRGGAIAGGA